MLSDERENCWQGVWHAWVRNEMWTESRIARLKELSWNSLGRSIMLKYILYNADRRL